MKRTMLTIVFFGLCGVPASLAQSYCSEPEVPYCLDAFGTFEEDFSFDSCKRDMESYVGELDSYANCLALHLDEKRNEADEAVEKFNCKARREDFCF